ncbi:hypothetical protein IMSAGC002_04615 [Lachnospiraceae bacterium]|nr:hypothetical protein IMSAGC002_04615 [Lachnospiraceae bacterium]
MKRSEQIEDLLNAIRKVDESKLQEVEKDFMKTVRAAARKIRVDEIREALRKAGIERTKDNGKTLNILLGYPDLPERESKISNPYSEEEEKRAIEALKGMGLKFRIGAGQQRGRYTDRVIRVEVGEV